MYTAIYIGVGELEVVIMIEHQDLIVALISWIRKCLHSDPYIVEKENTCEKEKSELMISRGGKGRVEIPRMET